MWQKIKNKETSTPSDATVNKKEIAEEEALDIAKADTNKKKEVKEDDTLADEKK